jgi:hypothetical protein
MKSYRVSRVTGDRYAGELPRELFRKHGIAYDLAKQTKSELFRDLLPLLNSGRIVLPRNDRLQGQIVGLERRTSAVGRDTISHPDRGHDDVANAVAGAAALSKFGGYDTSLRWVSGDDDNGTAWERVRFKPSSTARGASDYHGVLRALSRCKRKAYCARLQFLGNAVCSSDGSLDITDQLGEASLAVDQRQVAQVAAVMLNQLGGEQHRGVGSATARDTGVCRLSDDPVVGA